jgi:hypothetical protein
MTYLVFLMQLIDGDLSKFPKYTRNFFGRCFWRLKAKNFTRITDVITLEF